MPDFSMFSKNIAATFLGNFLLKNFENRKSFSDLYIFAKNSGFSALCEMLRI